jgi:hypothetical protein
MVSPTTSVSASITITPTVTRSSALWTLESAIGTYGVSYYGITWGTPSGNGLFVVVGSGSSAQGLVLTSPDGVTWTSQSAAVALTWNAVTWGNGLFVAVGGVSTAATNLVMTSSDGSTWTSRTSPASITISWRAVTWGNPSGSGLFVAVGSGSSQNNNLIMTSPDGTTWTLLTSPSHSTWYSVAWGGSSSQLFVAVGAVGAFMTSSDGINWNSATQGTNTWRSVVWGGPSGNQLFVAVCNSGTSGQRVMTSSNGSTWTIRSTPGGSLPLSSVAWGGTGLKQRFVAAPLGNYNFISSTNGINWILEQSPNIFDMWTAVASGNTTGQGNFIAVSSTSGGADIALN